MPDDRTTRGPQDKRLISLTEPHEVRYWATELNVTEERLKELVHEHGHSADNIRDAIKEGVARAESED